MANVVRAALVQATWTGDTESMIAKHEEHAREAARQGAKVIGFQEVFNAPYFCQVQEPEHYRWAEPVPDGPTVRRMQELARETGMVIVVPVFEVEQSGFYYNTAAVIDADGTYLGKYRKHHIPQVKGFWEKYYFKPGNARLAGLRHRRRQGRRLHLLRPPLPRGLAAARPERRPARLQPVRHLAAASPPTSGSWSSPRPPSPTSTSSPRSTGSAQEEYGDNDFYGTCYFVDPRGQFVGEVASDKEEELLVRDLDFDLIEEVRQQWAFYRDRRPDAYEGLVQP